MTARHSTDAARRAVSVCCLLLLVLCSLLQATHFHDSRRATPGHTGAEWLQADGGSNTEVNCPLCVTGNSALPVRPAIWLTVVLSFAAAWHYSVGRHVPTDVPFSQCTRPPPLIDPAPARAANTHALFPQSLLDHQVYTGHRAT